MKHRLSMLISTLVLATGLTSAALAQSPVLAVRHDSFFVGGHYAKTAGQHIMMGQMYVEALVPEHVTHPYPLVLIHGTGQTATNWMTTPDGREGWGTWFAAHGWAVYMVDQPARGRSAWQPDLQALPKALTAETAGKLFTAPEAYKLWPQAALHTQWPSGQGRGHIGAPVFDAFYASQVPSMSNSDTEFPMRAAGAALLDRIGPAIVLVHSQAGAFGWLMADARPSLVKGIVAVEPVGPPYKDEVFKSGTDRPYGLTITPLTYDPPATESPSLQFEQQSKPNAPDLAACWEQKGQVRHLTHLAGIPTLVASSEASYHAVYDHCTARFLAQAGVSVEFVRLADHDIRGNAHMMMMENNNLDIAAFLNSWIETHVHLEYVCGWHQYNINIFVFERKF